MTSKEIKAFIYPPSFFIQFDFKNGDRKIGAFECIMEDEFTGTNKWRIIESLNSDAYNQFGDINLTTIIDGSTLKSLMAIKPIIE